MKYNIFLDLGMYISECDIHKHIHTHKLFSHGVDRLTFKVTRLKKKNACSQAAKKLALFHLVTPSHFHSAIFTAYQVKR